MKLTPSCEIYIDGASRGNPGPAGIGVVLFELPLEAEAQRIVAHDDTQPVRQLSKAIGETTNNVAEYLALIYALQEALQQGYQTLTIKSDSELLVRQINGQYKVRDPRLRLFYDLALHLVRSFQTCSIRHIPRAQNALADRLAGHAADHQGRSAIVVAER